MALINFEELDTQRYINITNAELSADVIIRESGAGYTLTAQDNNYRIDLIIDRSNECDYTISQKEGGILADGTAESLGSFIDHDDKDGKALEMYVESLRSVLQKHAITHF